MKLAIVNDSVTACEGLQRLLQRRTDHSLLWTAHSGLEAIARCEGSPPDVILMDMIMPEMDGAETTRQILARIPCTILLVTASINQNTGKIFEAMGAGALDVVTTPRLDHPADETDFFRKLRQIQKLYFPIDSEQTNSANRLTAPVSPVQKVILIGSSAGGPAALASILSKLPTDLPTGIVIAQHMDSRFDDAFVSWLGNQTKWPLRKASVGDQVLNGEVLIAGADRHLIFTAGNQLSFTDIPQFSYVPSVDMLFSSAAHHWRGEIAAALLTGMGSDGAKGLKELREAGHLTLAQDKLSCALYGMPKVAAEIGAAREILPLNEIPGRLIQFSNSTVTSSL